MQWISYVHDDGIIGIADPDTGCPLTGYTSLDSEDFSVALIWVEPSLGGSLLNINLYNRIPSDSNATEGVLLCSIGNENVQLIIGDTAEVFIKYSGEISNQVDGQALRISYGAEIQGEEELASELLNRAFPLGRDRASLKLEYPLSLSEFTLEAWVLPEEEVEGCCLTIIDMIDWRVQIVDFGAIRLTVDDRFDCPRTLFTSQPTNVTKGQWSHFAVVLTKTSIGYYFDGVLFNRYEHSCDLHLSSDFFWVGRTESQPPDSRNKRIDELRLWSIEMDEDLISSRKDRQLFDYEISSNQNLQACYTFDPLSFSNIAEDEKTRIYNVPDLSSYNRHLQLGKNNIPATGEAFTARFSPKLVKQLEGEGDEVIPPIGGKDLSLVIYADFDQVTNELISTTIPLTTKATGLDLDLYETVITSLPDEDIIFKVQEEDVEGAIVNTTGPTSSNSFLLTYQPSSLPSSSTSRILFQSTFSYHLRLLSDFTQKTMEVVVYIDVVRPERSSPVKAGSALYCNSQDSNRWAYAKDFNLPLSSETNHSIPYTIEFWAFNYDPTYDALGTVYAMGNTEVIGEWCGDGPY
eukprot:Lithocolla_globosa_v1_NODE_74_length_6885_cov_10.215813.p2 type:complete len:576 gc:universal NODE_74_length_6885_cov_10.215813:3415-1688(-)